MSRHVWEVKPTKLKAGRMAMAFHTASRLRKEYYNDQSISLIAKTFAGYYAEHCAQNSCHHSIKNLLDGCIIGGWRIMRGKNRDNYLLAFQRHVDMIYRILLPYQLPAKDIATVALWDLEDAPWWVMRDKLVDLGYDGEAKMIASIFE